MRIPGDDDVGRNPGLRVAVISMHSSPLDQPGEGDAGGMNVYIRSVWERLARRGLSADIFTRRRGETGPEVTELVPGVRIVQVPAGPGRPLPKSVLPGLVPAFAAGIRARARGAPGPPHDLIHAHYWLSGRAGRVLRRSLGIPLVASFHTLARVKEQAWSSAEPESPDRARWETRVAHSADRILVSTQTDAEHLVRLYGADHRRIRIVSPGVDERTFAPRKDRDAQKIAGRPGARLVVFAGRPVDYKGPDVAIRTLAAARARDPGLMEPVALVLVGGSRNDADRTGLRRLAHELGVAEWVTFLPAQPQEVLAGLYAGAEAVLVPSRSETFGLVAAEALACGTPVIAAATGGLVHIVEDGVGGFLVEGNDPAEHATRLLRLLADPELQARMRREAVRSSARFSWERTADGVADLYAELVRPA